MKIFNILCIVAISVSGISYAGKGQSKPSNNLGFKTYNLQQFNSKRNGKLEMAGLLSQLAGNTLNQIGQATGNKELQIAGFATNQMGVNASAINAFRQKDGSFSGKQKQKNNPNNRGQQNQRQGNQGQSWGQSQRQNTFQAPINAPQPSPWQNQGPQKQPVDLMNMELPAQNMNAPVQNSNPPVQMQNPLVNGGLNNPPLNIIQPAQNLENNKENNKKDNNLIDFD